MFNTQIRYFLVKKVDRQSYKLAGEESGASRYFFHKLVETKPELKENIYYVDTNKTPNEC